MMMFSFIKFRNIALNCGQVFSESSTASVASSTSTIAFVLGGFFSDDPKIPAYETHLELFNQALTSKPDASPVVLVPSDWDLPTFLKSSVYFDRPECQKMIQGFDQTIRKSNSIIQSHFNGETVPAEQVQHSLVVLLELEPRSEKLARWCTYMMMTYMVFPIIEYLKSNPEFQKIPPDILATSLKEMSHSMLVLLYWNCFVDDVADVLKDPKLVHLFCELTMAQFDAKARSEPVSSIPPYSIYSEMMQTALEFSSQFMDLFFKHAMNNDEAIARQRDYLELLCICMKEAVRLTSHKRPSEYLKDLFLKNQDHTISPLMASQSHNMQVFLIAHSAMTAIAHAYCQTDPSASHSDAFDLLFPQHQREDLFRIIGLFQDISRVANNFGSLYREAKQGDLTNLFFHRILSGGSELDSFSSEILSNVLSSADADELRAFLYDSLKLMVPTDPISQDIFLNDFMQIIQKLRQGECVEKSVQDLSKNPLLTQSDQLASLLDAIILLSEKMNKNKEALSDFLCGWVISSELDALVDTYLIRVSSDISDIAAKIGTQKFVDITQVMPRLLIRAYIDAQNHRNQST